MALFEIDRIILVHSAAYLNANTGVSRRRHFLGEKSRNIFTFRFFVKGKCKAKIMPFFGSIVVIKRSGADGVSFPLIDEVRKSCYEPQSSVHII